MIIFGYLELKLSTVCIERGEQLGLTEGIKVLINARKRLGVFHRK